MEQYVKVEKVWKGGIYWMNVFIAGHEVAILVKATCCRGGQTQVSVVAGDNSSLWVPTSSLYKKVEGNMREDEMETFARY
jgi:hypothetical protein